MVLLQLGLDGQHVGGGEQAGLLHHAVGDLQGLHAMAYFLGSGGREQVGVFWGSECTADNSSRVMTMFSMAELSSASCSARVLMRAAWLGTDAVRPNTCDAHRRIACPPRRLRSAFNVSGLSLEGRSSHSRYPGTHTQTLRNTAAVLRPYTIKRRYSRPATRSSR